MQSPKSTVAFYGATGDCAGYCLAAALKAGHQCSALARTPQKLKDSLTAKGVPDESLANLHIVQGDARDEKAVRDTLFVGGNVVDVVISGIGSLPALQWSIFEPVTLRDRNICKHASETLVKALRSLSSAKKPLVGIVSTTGIAPEGKPSDIPLAYTFLYKWLLHVPHVDKQQMEQTLASAAAEPESTRPLSGFIAVKPTLLMDGPSLGLDRIRSGTEDSPAIGYTIRRHDVGEWMYANLIAQRPPQDWLGKGVCLTS